eukprot:PITA_16149
MEINISMDNLLNHGSQLRSGRTVTSKNQNRPTIIFEEKGEEETPNHSLKAINKQPSPSGSMPPSSNQPPFPERLVMERREPIFETSLALELQNMFIKIPLLQAIKEIPICTNIIKELCIKKPRRKKLEPQTIQFVGMAAELMIGCVSMEKYTDPRNPVVSDQIGNFLVSNVLIDLGVAINVMTKKNMDQLQINHLRPTPTMLELTDRSKIKLEGVLDDVIISLDSWEYPVDFIVLQPKNPVGGHPLILGLPWLATADAYIGCRFGDMYISHGDSRKKVTLYPPAISI